jgi:hypothetical protein
VGAGSPVSGTPYETPKIISYSLKYTRIATRIATRIDAEEGQLARHTLEFSSSL